jgi:hypothetical protein
MVIIALSGNKPARREVGPWISKWGINLQQRLAPRDFGQIQLTMLVGSSYPADSMADQTTFHFATFHKDAHRCPPRFLSSAFVPWTLQRKHNLNLLTDTNLCRQYVFWVFCFRLAFSVSA